MKGKKRVVRFQTKIVFAVLGVLVPMFLIITFLFFKTSVEMRNKLLDTIEYDMEEMMTDLEEVTNDMIQVSNFYSAEEKLTDFLEGFDGEEDKLVKRYQIITIQQRLFEGYDLLNQNARISAIYTDRGDVFNIADPNCDSEEVVEKIAAMNLFQKDRLAQFVWYPLQDNFLKQNPYGAVRKDKVIIGSRNIFSFFRSGYVASHLFVLPEECVYETYRIFAEEMGASVYVLNAEGALLSSSNMADVEAGKLSEELSAVIREQGEGIQKREIGNQKQFVKIKTSLANQWKMVVVIPRANITKQMDLLYYQIFSIVGICMASCAILLLFLYKRFMEPLAQLNTSMREVYEGNLDAYVEVKNKNEIGTMMQYYNAMLESINRNIAHRIGLEKKKRELELEVLMNQINPHFLYNTLETIVWKAGEAKRPDIGRIAASLGRLYRLSISNGELIIRLQQEIEHLMAYVNIQKSRYQDKFELDLRADKESVRDLYVLKLIMQPIVENCFLYAMDDLNRILKIRVRISVNENYLKIKVIDNGKGMSQERLEQVREQMRSGVRIGAENRKSTGIGLHSVSQRISLYLEVEGAVKISSKENVGTVICVKLPRMLEQQSMK